MGNQSSVKQNEQYNISTQNFLLNNNSNNPFKSLPKCNCEICSAVNQEMKIIKMFLIYRCNVPLDKLDKTYDLTSGFTGWRQESHNGPPRYLKKFIPPFGWTAIGINVLNKYDNGDNTWIGTSNVDGEWYIGYHGIKDKEAVLGILMNGFLIGPGQMYEKVNNTNPLSYYNHMWGDKGAYFTPDINEAERYTGIIKYNEYNLRIVFMCRINPQRVRTVDIGGNREYWITNGTTDEVRPYKILFKFENNINY